MRVMNRGRSLPSARYSGKPRTVALTFPFGSGLIRTSKVLVAVVDKDRGSLESLRF
jgi:hypothetical protein